MELIRAWDYLDSRSNGPDAELHWMWSMQTRAVDGPVQCHQELMHDINLPNRNSVDAWWTASANGIQHIGEERKRHMSLCRRFFIARSENAVTETKMVITWDKPSFERLYCETSPLFVDENEVGCWQETENTLPSSVDAMDWTPEQPAEGLLKGMTFKFHHGHVKAQTYLCGMSRLLRCGINKLLYHVGVSLKRD